MARVHAPHGVRLTSGLFAHWQGAFFADSALETSGVTARALGLPGALAPWWLAHCLTMSLGVDVFSKHCKIHLALRGSDVSGPLQEGDEVGAAVDHIAIRRPDGAPVESAAAVVAAGDDEHFVARTRHALLRAGSGEEVASTVKDSLFTAGGLRQFASRFFAESSSAEQGLGSDASGSALFDQVTRAAGGGLVPDLFAAKAAAAAWPAPQPGDMWQHTVHPGLHAPVHASLCNLTRNTHPVHHFPAHRPVVAGPFVHAVADAAASRDLPPLLHQRLVYSDNVTPLAPGEPCTAVSHVLGVHAQGSVATADLATALVRAEGDPPAAPEGVWGLVSPSSDLGADAAAILTPRGDGAAGDGDHWGMALPGRGARGVASLCKGALHRRVVMRMVRRIAWVVAA